MSSTLALLALVLLAHLAIAVPSTVLLFVRTARRPRLGALSRALLLAAGLGVAVTVVAQLLDVAGTGEALVAGVASAASVLAWVKAAHSWTTLGLAAWSATVTAGLAFLAYALIWTLTADIGTLSRVGSLVLFGLETFVFLLALGYVWETVDVLARFVWRRRVHVDRGRASVPGQPFVSLHVPTHNEPPDLVIETLQHLLDLDYDEYEVLLLDNNTTDPALWQPVEAFCAPHDKLRFFHLEDWPGYKSGALNFGLDQVDPRTELIGVVDADYQVDPDFLSSCTPLFRDTALAFVQTPQDYREWDTDAYFRRLYWSYAYFFDVSQRSRNERNGAIFGGTMGLIRREALEQVGGWDEWCITEDAELSLRLLRAGWSGTHVEESFGRGIMPLTFEALKRQRFRWCFGGIQILRMHVRSMVPGPRTTKNRLSLGQRWAYFVGGLQWFGDLAGLLFTAFLLLGAANLAVGDGLTVRRYAAPILVAVVGLLVLGVLRSLALLRRLGKTGWRGAAGAQLLWLGLGWVVAQASVRGLVAREGAFLRTPKVRGEVTWRDVIRGNLVECALVLVCLAGVVAGVVAVVHGHESGAVVALLILFQAAGHLAAPLNSLAAARADLTPELRRRRTRAMPSWARVAPGVRRYGLGPGLVVVVALLAITLLATPTGSPPLGDFSQAVQPDDGQRDQRSEPVTRDDPANPPDPLTSSATSPSPRPGGPTTTRSHASASTPTASPTVVPTRPQTTVGPTVAPTQGNKPTRRPTQANTPTAKPTRGKPSPKPDNTNKPTAKPTRAGGPSKP